jgi:hypothetical protein
MSPSKQCEEIRHVKLLPPCNRFCHGPFFDISPLACLLFTSCRTCGSSVLNFGFPPFTLALMAPPLTGETGKTAYRRYRPYAERDAGEDEA